jgi:hypothetical protein
MTINEVLEVQLMDSLSSKFLLLVEVVFLIRKIEKLRTQKLETHLRPEFTKSGKADIVDLVVSKVPALQQRNKLVVE